ncbi:DUF438 domain-containing protein [Brachyspira hampsonii]|uniref:Uncharacterized protein n=1 Tax=Brachyspira hampsonii 30446 TaxID=1289135 RepID=A0A2U4FLB7_9SPIR|nr:DUF438 domain-containing protein [Brachyspira hampsonii]EKV58251.1 hypothetical protein A966_00665 [Brachyspira hampsonii 30446]MBW5390366.1 DUF438 domain-containing protein [Brachyspira hampsonii]MBW5395668.1 DUF438 domain-containing protein [Brachyspira hampsonii]OEJ20234.1 histidine kinase [Brachyspira hampsonii]
MTTLEYINTNETIYNLCTKYPQIKEILFDLGFDKIKNPIMFNTVSKVMTLDKAIKMKSIDIEKLRKKFNEHGFDFENDRNEILKSLIVKLHCGENIEKIKREFENKLVKVSAEEVHNAMHELVNNGMSIDEAKRFFYIRTLVLKDAMDNNTEIDYKAIDILKEENRYIEKLLDEIIVNDNINLLEELYNNLNRHYIKKESLFFTALKKHGNDEPSKVMSKVDRDILNELKDIISYYQKNNNQINFESIKLLKEHISDMIFKEENILIPLSVSVLTKEDFDDIEIKYGRNS